MKSIISAKNLSIALAAIQVFANNNIIWLTACLATCGIVALVNFFVKWCKLSVSFEGAKMMHSGRSGPCREGRAHHGGMENVAKQVPEWWLDGLACLPLLACLLSCCMPHK